MSIVYDYLKKIRDQKETTPIATTTSRVDPVSSRPLSIRRIAAGVLGALLVGTAICGAVLTIQKALTRHSRATGTSRQVHSTVPDFNFLLEGIIYNPSKPFAIIDGKMYETGGRFGDFEVTQITPDTVSLKSLKDNTIHTAHL